MPLTDLHALVSVIESLQERIRRHYATIGANEIRTRTALIDPLLNALGWNTADPAMVIPEYTAGGGVADYALLKVKPDESSPVIAFVEAKRLSEPLRPHRTQMLTYSNMAGVKYAGLTNGDRWELYEVFKEAPLNERRILNISLSQESAIDCATKLMLLNLRNLAAWTIALLLNGAAPNGRTPLHEAAQNGKAEVVEMLLYHGASVAAKDSGDATPLHYAAKFNAESAVIGLLLEQGADVTARDSNGATPLHHAVRIHRQQSACCLSRAQMSQRGTAMALRPCTTQRGRIHRQQSACYWTMAQALQRKTTTALRPCTTQQSPIHRQQSACYWTMAQALQRRTTAALRLCTTRHGSVQNQ